MSNTIARSSDEIRAVLDALAGEHLPSRKTYLASGFFVLVCGIFFPVLLAGLLIYRGAGIDLLRDYEALFTIVGGPLLAFSLLQTSMSRYVVDDAHIACTAPLGIGSWTMMRAEIERIEANVGTVGMSLTIHSGLQKPKTMPLRKRTSDRFFRRYPELRRVRAKVNVEERKRKQKNKIVLIAFIAIFAAIIAAFIAMVVYR